MNTNNPGSGSYGGPRDEGSSANGCGNPNHCVSVWSHGACCPPDFNGNGEDACYETLSGICVANHGWEAWQGDLTQCDDGAGNIISCPMPRGACCNQSIDVCYDALTSFECTTNVADGGLCPNGDTCHWQGYGLVCANEVQGCEDTDTCGPDQFDCSCTTCRACCRGNGTGCELTTNANCNADNDDVWYPDELDCISCIEGGCCYGDGTVGDPYGCNVETQTDCGYREASGAVNGWDPGEDCVGSDPCEECTSEVCGCCCEDPDGDGVYQTCLGCCNDPNGCGGLLSQSACQNAGHLWRSSDSLSGLVEANEDLDCVVSPCTSTLIQGACCSADGTSCYYTTGALCWATGDNYWGDDYTCEEVAVEGGCVADTGICCEDEFTCSEKSYAECQALGGYNWVSGTTCGDPFTTCDVGDKGRCCLGSGCFPDYPEQECLQCGGDWNEKNSCTEAPCPTDMGVCCIADDVCVPEWTCCHTKVYGGTDWQAIDCVECELEDTYACCVGGACYDYGETECSENDGTLLMQYESCSAADADGDACGIGACCVNEQTDQSNAYCINTIKWDCNTYTDHFWHDINSTCDDPELDYCGPGDGACCLPNGTCADNHDNQSCGNKGGIYYGDNTNCAEHGTDCGVPDCVACEMFRNRNRNGGGNRNTTEHQTRVQIETGECVWMMCVPPNCPYPICPD